MLNVDRHTSTYPHVPRYPDLTITLSIHFTDFNLNLCKGVHDLAMGKMEAMGEKCYTSNYRQSETYVEGYEVGIIFLSSFNFFLFLLPTSSAIFTSLEQRIRNCVLCPVCVFYLEFFSFFGKVEKKFLTKIRWIIFCLKRCLLMCDRQQFS